MKRTSKREMGLRAGDTAKMLADGHSGTTTTFLMAEKYSLSRRQPQRITAAGYDLLVEDLVKINIQRTHMTAKLIVNLETGLNSALKNNQGTAVAACVKQLINLCGRGPVKHRYLIGTI